MTTEMGKQGSCPIHREPGECAAVGCDYWDMCRAMHAKVLAGICPVNNCTGVAAVGELCAKCADRVRRQGNIIYPKNEIELVGLRASSQLTLSVSPATAEFIGDIRAMRRGELKVGEDSALLVRVLKAYQAEDDARFAAFVDSSLDDRDTLAFSALCGEAMTAEDRERLASLDATLAPLLPKPDPMPADVTAAIAEVRGIK